MRVTLPSPPPLLTESASAVKSEGHCPEPEASKHGRARPKQNPFSPSSAERLCRTQRSVVPGSDCGRSFYAVSHRPHSGGLYQLRNALIFQNNNSVFRIWEFIGEKPGYSDGLPLLTHPGWQDACQSGLFCFLHSHDLGPSQVTSNPSILQAWAQVYILH